MGTALAAACETNVWRTNPASQMNREAFASTRLRIKAVFRAAVATDMMPLSLTRFSTIPSLVLIVTNVRFRRMIAMRMLVSVPILLVVSSALVLQVLKVMARPVHKSLKKLFSPYVKYAIAILYLRFASWRRVAMESKKQCVFAILATFRLAAILLATTKMSAQVTLVVRMPSVSTSRAPFSAFATQVSLAMLCRDAAMRTSARTARTTAIERRRSVSTHREVLSASHNPVLRLPELQQSLRLPSPLFLNHNHSPGNLSAKP